MSSKVESSMAQGRNPAVACVGCSATVPDVSGPTHPYMLASPGCWRLYGQLCAQWVYSPAAGSMARAHHVDCYAVQHPGGAEHDRRQRQSVAVHLVSLCLLLEFDQPPERAGATRSRTSQDVLGGLGHDDWLFLKPPALIWEVTAADVYAAMDTNRTEAAFTGWLEASWQAWSHHHATIRRWAGIMAGTT